MNKKLPVRVKCMKKKGRGGYLFWVGEMLEKSREPLSAFGIQPDA